MAKPKQEPVSVEAELSKVPAKKKVLAKVFQMVVGVDLIGSKMSMAASKTLQLEVTPLGIKATSAKGRVVLIPWTNIKGCELYPSDE